MKLLYITDVYPPEFETSVGSIVFNLAGGMKQRGHQVAILCATRDRQKVGRSEENGIMVYRVFANFAEKLRAYLGLYNPQSVRDVKKVFVDFEPDVVHVHLVHYLLSYHVLKLAKQSGAKVVMTAHDVMLFHYGKMTEFIYRHPELVEGSGVIPIEFNYHVSTWQLLKRFKKRYNPLRNIIIRHYLNYVDKILAVSESLKQALEQNGIKNVDVVYNGIDADKWQTKNQEVEKFRQRFDLRDKKIVLFGGRLSGLKGSNQLVKTLALLKEKIVNLVLLVVGTEDNYASEIKKMADQNKVNVVFTGWLNGDDLKAAYYASDVVVTPSICLDTFNLMNIEAMAAAKPVVGTCFGGTPEIVKEQETGFIINPYNTQDFANKIVTLLSDEELAEKMGEAGRRRVRDNFTLKQQIENYLKWYTNNKS